MVNFFVRYCHINAIIVQMSKFGIFQFWRNEMDRWLEREKAETLMTEEGFSQSEPVGDVLAMSVDHLDIVLHGTPLHLSLQHLLLLLLCRICREQLLLARKLKLHVLSLNTYNRIFWTSEMKLLKTTSYTKAASPINNHADTYYRWQLFEIRHTSICLFKCSIAPIIAQSVVVPN